MENNGISSGEPFLQHQLHTLLLAWRPLSVMDINLQFLLFLTLLTLYPNAQSLWAPLPPTSAASSPLCSSQLALVSHACSSAAYTPASVETLRHHEHRHPRQRPAEGSPADTECCRWLKEADDVCVCELLVHLPQFLTKPAHSYTIAVDDSCDVTFSCGSKS